MAGTLSHRGWIGLLVVSVLTLTATSLGSAPAEGEAPTDPPTLTGQAFVESSSPFLEPRYPGSCDRTADSSFTYDSSGVTDGPYPGTYTEQGTITVGPQTLPDRGYLPNPVGAGFVASSRGFPTGLVTVHAEFHIDSAVGDVTGTKTLVAATTDDVGACLDFTDELVPESGRPGTGYIRDAYATVSYDATITTAAGTFQDTGSAFLFMQDLSVFWTDGGGGSASGTHFVEAFTSALSAPKSLRVTADDKSKVYGQPNPVLTHTISGFVDGDTSAVVSGAPTLSTPAGQFSDAGDYPIEIDQGTLSADGYGFTLVPGTLTITPAPTTLVAAPVVARLLPPRIYFPRLSARLTYGAAGSPTANQTVRFTVGSTVVCTGTTDAAGVASCAGSVSGTLSVVLRLGYDAVFAGSQNYLPSSDHGPLLR
jgi:MBG domain (YGX type)